MKKLKAVDLFCGLGGFSTGISQAGIDIVLAVDNNELALEAHEKNHPNTKHLLLDLRDKTEVDKLIEIIKENEIDIIIGSPPCQSFSTANPERDPKKGLELVEVLFYIVEQVKPKYWVGENVLSSKTAIQKNFNLEGVVLNSVDYGVAQKRKRFFFGDFPIPKPFSEPNLIKDILESKENTEHLWKHFNDLSDSAKRIICDDKIQGKTSHPFYQVRFAEEPSKTITAHRDNRYLLLPDIPKEQWKKERRNCNYRFFTMTELKRIMGFDSDYIVLGSIESKIRQIGNSVCPPVAKAIGKEILKNEKL